MNYTNNTDNFMEKISNDFISNLNNTFNKITNNYNKIYSKIPSLLNNYILPFNNIIDLDSSLNELSIQLQSILFIIEREDSSKMENENNVVNDGNNDGNNDDNNDNDSNNDNDGNNDNYEKEIKKDKIVNKTLIKMLPLFFYYLMMIDNESIINSKTFGESIKKSYSINNLNGQPNLDNIDNIDNIEKAETLDFKHKTYSDISNISLPYIELD